MFDILIVGHGNFATGIVSSLELIAGKQESIKYIDFHKGMTSDELEVEIKNMYDKVDKKLLVLADLVGGTPFNTAILQKGDRDIEVVGGINLPLVLEIVTMKNSGALVDIDSSIKVAMECIKKF